MDNEQERQANLIEQERQANLIEQERQANLIRLLFNIPEPVSRLNLDDLLPNQFGRIIVYKNLENQRRK